MNPVCTVQYCKALTGGKNFANVTPCARPHTPPGCTISKPSVRKHIGQPLVYHWHIYLLSIQYSICYSTLYIHVTCICLVFWNLYLCKFIFLNCWCSIVLSKFFVFNKHIKNCISLCCIHKQKESSRIFTVYFSLKYLECNNYNVHYALTPLMWVNTPALIYTLHWVQLISASSCLRYTCTGQLELSSPY